MKHVFRLTGEEVTDVLGRHIITRQGWDNELCSWRVTLDLRIKEREVEVTLERVPVQLRSVPSESDGRGEDEKGRR